MLIDKIPIFLEAFKVIILAATTKHSWFWVGLLVTSSKNIAENTQDV